MSCPLNGKICKGGVREDFKRGELNVPVLCRWWVHLYGKDPQTDKTVDQWDCAVAWLPTTTIETSQNSRQTTASLDKVANVANEVGHKLAQIGARMAQHSALLEKKGPNGTS